MTELETTSRASGSDAAAAVERHVRGAVEALARHDLEGLVAHWAEDGILDVVPIGVFRGRDEIEGLFREALTAAPDLRASAGVVVADGARAAVEWRIGGTFTGAPFQGFDPTGREFELRGVDLVEVEDGATVRATTHYDGAAFARQIGLLPAQDSGAEQAVKGAFNALTKLRKMIDERTSGA
ncbi:MAG: ester cyclase [Nocardioidaceae bacterium]